MKIRNTKRVKIENKPETMFAQLMAEIFLKLKEGIK